MTKRGTPTHEDYKRIDEALRTASKSLTDIYHDTCSDWEGDHPFMLLVRQAQEAVTRAQIKNDASCYEHHAVWPSEAEPGELDRVEDLSLSGEPLGTVWDGEQWGPWEYKAETLVLTYKQGQYEIDLEDCNSSAAILDWIAQIAGKVWASPEDIGHLVHALDALAFTLQGTVCGLGQDKTFDMAAHLRKVTRGTIGI